MALSEPFEALMERAFSGDGEAFDELYRLIHRYLRNFMGSVKYGKKLSKNPV